MKRFAIGLTIAIATLATAAFAQTDPNAPTGPHNPNQPAQVTGSQVPMPCGLGASPAAPPAPSAGQPQVAQGDRPAGAVGDKPAASAGCAAPDRPPGASTPAPATPHP